MYSTPDWALPFAAHCRARLSSGEARIPGASRFARTRHWWQALAAHRSAAEWHVACWVHRRGRGNA